MRAARFHGHYDIRIDEISAPVPKRGEVLIDIAWGGICGTDLREYLMGPKAICTKNAPHRLTGAYLPVTMGHEFCGHITYAPNNACGADGIELKVGATVVVDPRLSCGTCFSCNLGEARMCSKWGFLGLHGDGGGGFSETCAVRADMCYTLPPSTPLDHAVLIEPLVVGRHALVQSGVPLNEFISKSVLVVGGGPVGFSVLCNLAVVGVKQVFVSEPAKARQGLVRSYADQVLDPTKQIVSEECRKATGGRGVDLVFDCAGVPPGMRAGFDSLKPKGTYVNVAGWEVDFVVPVTQFMANEITIRSTLAYDDKDFGDVVRDFVAGKYRGAESMITTRISLEDLVQDGFEQLVRHRDQHMKVISTPKPDLLPRKRRNYGAANGT